MQVFRWVLFLLPILATTYLRAKSNPGSESLTPQERGEFNPWFTGSLLSGAGHTVPPGHINLEPYLYVFGNIGGYNECWRSISTSHSVTIVPLFFLSIGLSDRTDLTLLPQLQSNFQDHASDTRVADLPINMGFQFLVDRRGSWMPDMRFLIKTIFPTGHYQHLNPDKNGTDATGFGSYQAGVGCNTQKTFHLGRKLLRLRFNIDYYAPASVHVRGFNAYGGGYGTSGRVNPGHFFNSILAFEYTFTQHWIGALDIKYSFIGSSRFSGKPGILPSGEPATVGIPSNQLISLAPAIEYAFSRNLGLIFGSWFTVAGKNSGRFVSGVIALNYYH